MKIFYFTGTGNSLQVARNLAQHFDNCELVPIISALKSNAFIIEDDVVGFICPLHFQSIPTIVEDFINKIDLSSASYIFTVITRGACWSTGAVSQLKEILKKRGYNLLAGFYFTAIDNYPLFYNLPHFLIKPLSLLSYPFSKTLEELPQKVNAKVLIVRDIIKKQAKYFEKEKIFRFILIPLMRGLYRKKANTTSKYFSVNNGCNGCELCFKICPVNNIRIEKNKPIWLNQCAACFACVNFCPTKAIQFLGFTTRNVGRYTNPSVSSKEIIEQKIYKFLS